jgi:hypothetical protein
MKLFMMPHTVPNRPTNGAVAPIEARDTPRGRRLDALEPRGDALLQPVGGRVRRQAHLGERGAYQRRDVALVEPGALGGFGEALRLRQPVERRARRALGAEQLEPFGEQHRPGDHRGDREPDHDELHDDVGRLEHAPRRQVLRQCGEQAARRGVLCPGGRRRGKQRGGEGKRAKAGHGRHGEPLDNETYSAGSAASVRNAGRRRARRVISHIAMPLVANSAGSKPQTHTRPCHSQPTPRPLCSACCQASTVSPAENAAGSRRSITWAR